ncbi:hypothetical protein ANANG_G00221450 [Anguilla anguilla]|uniref:SOCS box domain-containing protein n=1 Tax=Anguilla anguilla TaxID=7936 RepID=A0A9D3M081_ANGAN|nr:hypothetical protein ANANG_G00221450 [Anguilla anguilla]
MSSTMWYIMQSIQSKYSLSERLIRTIAFIRSFPHDNVEDLIRRGADVNRMHGTLKPLHCACMVADVDCVELLLEKGAEVNAVDGYNRTALHYAAEKDESCVELLLEYGALPDALDGNKDTPLHWAAFKDNPECARACWRAGPARRPRLQQRHAAELGGHEGQPGERARAAGVRRAGARDQPEGADARVAAGRAAGAGPGRRARGGVPAAAVPGGGEARPRSWPGTPAAGPPGRRGHAPPSLRSLARRAVRGPGRPLPARRRQELPLPESVQEYVLLRH